MVDLEVPAKIGTEPHNLQFQFPVPTTFVNVLYPIIAICSGIAELQIICDKKGVKEAAWFATI